MRFAPALAVAVVFAGGSALVFADGGDPTQIHACVESNTTRPNVIVVGPNDSCPAGTTAIHWPAGDTSIFDLPPELLGAGSQQILDLVPPSNAANKKIYKGLGVRPTKTKQVSENFSFVTDGGVFGGQVTATCPGSHPYRLTGGHQYSSVFGNWDGQQWIWSNPVGDHGWYYQAALKVIGPAQVAGAVTLTCAAVKPQADSVQKP